MNLQASSIPEPKRREERRLARGLDTQRSNAATATATATAAGIAETDAKLPPLSSGCSRVTGTVGNGSGRKIHRLSLHAEAQPEFGDPQTSVDRGCAVERRRRLAEELDIVGEWSVGGDATHDVGVNAQRR